MAAHQEGATTFNVVAKTRQLKMRHRQPLLIDPPARREYKCDRWERVGREQEGQGGQEDQDGDNFIFDAEVFAAKVHNRCGFTTLLVGSKNQRKLIWRLTPMAKMLPNKRAPKLQYSISTTEVVDMFESDLQKELDWQQQPIPDVCYPYKEGSCAD